MSNNLVKARVLLAWLPPERGAQVLAGQNISRVLPSQKERALRACSALQTRPSLAPANAIRPLPATLEPYVAKFLQSAKVQEMIAVGYSPQMINLNAVYALQQIVIVDDAAARVRELAVNDPAALAKVCLPIPGTTPISAQYDDKAQCWVLSSANQNLRIVGNWSGPIPEGHVVFGFAVNVVPSYVQVLRLGNRCYLRDGYHRCLGLLMRGITSVPALCKEISSPQELALTSDLLPLSVCTAENAPLLADYLDSELAADCEVPVPLRNIVVQGLQYKSFAIPSV